MTGQGRQMSIIQIGFKRSRTTGRTQGQNRQGSIIQTSGARYRTAGRLRVRSGRMVKTREN
jgi:hypothetical protein